MIGDEEVAKKVSAAMLEVFARVDECVQLVREESPADLEKFKDAASKIACTVIFEVCEPLYEAHPSLKPANWDE